MPGTIQVSVFDFKNISSSAPSSSICLWVSMGKRAYQTWDKGDFSFPLTTFRENLVVRLQDAEGNEISRTEVKTLSIVEKGYWDDFFQLERGDYVHMKLQFALTEDERNRIRNVRESALRKKLKVPATNIEYKGTAMPVRASSLAIRKEFSDRSEANSSSPVKEGVEIQYSEPDRPSAKKLQTQLIPVYEQDGQSILKLDVTGKKQSLSRKKISNPSNNPEDQSAQSMLKMDVAVNKASVSQKKIFDPSNKSEDESEQSLLKIDVAAKKEFVSQEKIVDPSNKPEDQSVQSMLKMDVAARKAFVSQEKIDPSNKPEDQSAQTMLKMDVAAKKEFVSQKKIVDPSNKAEDQSAQSMLKMDVAAKKEPVSQMKIVDPSNKPEGQSAQSMLKMDVAANNESISQEKNVDPSNKSEDQDAQSMLKMDVAAKKESISQKKNADSSNKPEDQGVLEKTPSSVRKMISAFETGLTQKKGRRSLTRNRASKSQPNLVGIGGSLRDLDPEDTARPNKMSALRLERPLNTVDFPEPQIDIGKRGDSSFPAQVIVGMEQPVFHEQLEQSNVHIVQVNETSSSQQENLRSAKEESTTEATSPVYRMRGESSSHEQDIVGVGLPVFHEQLKQPSVHIAPFNETGLSQQETFGSATKESNTVAASPVGLMRLSDLQTATSSQTTNLAHPDMLKANDLAADQDRLNGPSVAEKRNREVRSETLPEVHSERASNVKPKLVAFCENELYDTENSGAWIFPDNKKRQCVTTAGKNIVHLSEDFSIGVDDHQSNKRPPMQEITGKFFHIIDSMTKKGREKPQKPRNQSESSGENGSSGPVRQVIKIALIVGFGILVLLTRQRETRRNDRKSKESYNISPDFMDQLASSEEQWTLTVEGD